MNEKEQRFIDDLHGVRRELAAWDNEALPERRPIMTGPTAPAAFEPDWQQLNRAFVHTRRGATLEESWRAFIEEYEKQRADAGEVSVSIRLLKMALRWSDMIEQCEVDEHQDGLARAEIEAILHRRTR